MITFTWVVDFSVKEMMAAVKVVKTSVTVNNIFRTKLMRMITVHLLVNYTYADDHSPPTRDVTPVFKPFTVYKQVLLFHQSDILVSFP